MNLQGREWADDLPFTLVTLASFDTLAQICL